MAEKVVIIGAGIGGLSAGIYARLNGYDVDIYEAHTGPGGLCATWQRDRYKFDGCIHFLFGTIPGSSLYDFWNELGVFDKIECSYHPEYLTVLPLDKKKIIIYKNASVLKDHLIEVSPEDKSIITKFCDDIITLSSMPTDTYRIPPEMIHLPSAGEYLAGAAPFLPLMRELCSTTLEQTFTKLKSSSIRDSLYYIMPPQSSLFALCWTMAQFHRGDGAWVKGGSLQLARALECRFIEIGGRVHYSSRVNYLQVAESKVNYITVNNTDTIDCDYIISAIDGHTSLYELIDEKYRSIVLKDCYERFEPISGITQVSFGIDTDLSMYPHHECVELEEPFTFADREVRHCIFRHYCDDPSMAPQGHSVVTSLLLTSFDFWKQYSANRAEYENVKQQILKKLQEEVIKRYQLTSCNIVCSDVASPLTHNRMTSVWRGAYNGWLHTPENAFATIPKTLPGLKNMFFAGQWVAPGGGLPLAAVSGRWAVQLMQQRLKREFCTLNKSKF
jgi:phytoene dehydrogenase-like protein